MAAVEQKAEQASPAADNKSDDDIRALMGLNDSESEIQEKTGIRAIVNSALVSYERLPMLEIVFDRLVRLMTTSLRNFTSDNVEVSLDRITSVRFGDYLNSIPLPIPAARLPSPHGTTAPTPCRAPSGS